MKARCRDSSRPSIPARLGLLALGTVLSACTATRPAPVVDRTSPPPAAPAPGRIVSVQPEPVPARTAPPAAVAPSQGAAVSPGSQFHVVQRGETLYRIALNNRIDLQSLAAWNNMTVEQPLREGQVLRLTPPSGAVAQTAPVAPAPAPVHVQPLPAPISTLPAQPAPQPSTAAPSVPPLPASDLPVRREPRAQRLAYSEQALAEMQREGRSATAPTAAPVQATAAVNTPSGAPAVASPQEPEVRPGADAEREGRRWTWPTTGRVVTRFNDKSPLKGIEIAAPSGTPVVAAAQGKVIFVGNELRGCGQMVVISHGDGLVSVYCHLSKISVKEQQRVTLGQRIAEVGESGQPKLHFEVRRQGKPLDPLTLMPKG